MPGGQRAGCGAHQGATRHGDPAGVCGHHPGKEVGLSHKISDIPAFRCVIQFPWRANLHDPAALHHANAVRHRQRLFLIVGDQNKGDAQLTLQGQQFDLHVTAQLFVQRRHRFIQQQQLGLVDDGARQGHALLLAARHFIGAARAITGQAHGFQRPVNRAGDRRTRQPWPLLAQAIGDIVKHAQMRKQRIMLKHHVDRAAIGRQIVDPHPVQQHIARGWHLKPRQHPQGGGLAAPRRAEKRQKLAPADRQADIAGRHNLTEQL